MLFIWSGFVFDLLAFGLAQMIGVDLSKDEVILNKRTDDITTSYLIIHDAETGDTGKYTCAPSNSAPTSIVVHVLQGEYTREYVSISGTSGRRTLFDGARPLAIRRILRWLVDDEIWQNENVHMPRVNLCKSNIFNRIEFNKFIAIMENPLSRASHHFRSNILMYNIFHFTFFSSLVFFFCLSAASLRGMTTHIQVNALEPCRPAHQYECSHRRVDVSPPPY